MRWKVPLAGPLRAVLQREGWARAHQTARGCQVKAARGQWEGRCALPSLPAMAAAARSTDDLSSLGLARLAGRVEVGGGLGCRCMAHSPASSQVPRS